MTGEWMCKRWRAQPSSEEWSPDPRNPTFTDCGRLWVPVSRRRLGPRCRLFSGWWEYWVLAVVGQWRELHARGSWAENTCHVSRPWRPTSCPALQNETFHTSTFPLISFGPLRTMQGPAAGPCPVLSQGPLPAKAFPHSWSVHSSFFFQSVAQVLLPAGSSP